ncbi:4-carboxy-4-hydroxy-2-oxoadipate aldolase/oxaloacetate decarboxylase [Aquibacillus sp. 3ASR75-11]|uniref:Putative 4-hydroxy-4-methyl-2-oxoglutarate aldolase n=1 Tax=Terrihalobacillus insolitus TaxID=2950438 RepID=A0A9X3WR29_9BACI|nr:4-carboxy-4-hydroxy-2-oxoadipate aldolase/oxaloacetate decarboxylase [Terrihalobacillus insolitus]MDC3424220.1 4-carboxy-4-hydroxy-2-oxoadipate aldolase/oxaloacetate decarboxylase [Terrihalobacillus insolitus]
MNKYVVKDFPRPDQSKVDILAQFDVATVYEAQGKTGLVSDELKPIASNQSICGPAVTAVCYAGDNLMIHAAIETCKPGDILVITTVGESKSGMIGELIVEALRKRGVQGVIIDAGIRDVARIRELGFPVWSKAIFSEGTTKVRAGWVNAPTVCGGTTIHPGDIIFADDDGVVNIRQEDIDFAIEKSKQRMIKEANTKERIARGELSLDFYNLRNVLKDNDVVYYKDIQELKEAKHEKV